MPRFRIPEDKINDRSVSISGRDYRHIVRVLRYNEGDRITLFTNSREYTAEIEKITDKEIIVTIFGSFNINRESKLEINLFQGMLKSGKMDLIVQKCTELGVKSITPVNNHRSQLNYTKKIPRWRRIAEEACKQCGRNVSVKINDIVTPEDIVYSLSGDDMWILFDTESEVSLRSYLIKKTVNPESINLVIGPEGGFSQEEKILMKSRNIPLLKLGPRILRAETAAISAVSVVQYLFGDV